MPGKTYIELTYDTQLPTGRILPNKDIPEDKLDIPHKNISLREIVRAVPSYDKLYYELSESVQITATKYIVTLTPVFRGVAIIKEAKKRKVKKTASVRMDNAVDSINTRDVIFSFLQLFIQNGDYSNWPQAAKNKVQALNSAITLNNEIADHAKTLIAAIEAAATAQEVKDVDIVSGWPR